MAKVVDTAVVVMATEELATGEVNVTEVEEECVGKDDEPTPVDVFTD